MLNRRLFGQWLLRKALDKGATLLTSTQCLEPTIQKNCVTGISARNMRTGENLKLRGKVVLDASGFLGVIRRRLPGSMNIETEVANDDVEACYREIRQLKEETEKTDYCKIFLNQKATPGGYTWVFPKIGSRVNVGLGVCMKGNFPNPKTQFHKYVLTKPLFDGSLLLKAGSWYDPTRRPFNNMVGNGVAILGDAACLVNPIHGGGIGPSMLSGFLAGRTVVEALEKGNVNQEILWSYNCKYMEMYGAKQAALDVFRYILLGSRDEDIIYGMKQKLLTEDDILRAGLGEEFRLKISETAKRVFRGLGRMRFLNKLRLAVNLMRQVKAHYRNYPETPESFEKWRMETQTLFKETRSRLSE